MWPQISTFCSHNSKCDCKMLKVVVTWQQLSKCDCNISKSAITWLQLSKYDCKIRKVTVKFTNIMVDLKKWLQSKKNAVTWLWFLVKFNCNFQHFAVTFRIMTVTLNILQSHFELWLQLSTFYSHTSNYDCNFQYFAVNLCLQNVENCSHVPADYKSYSHVFADFKSCSQFSNYDYNLLKVAVIIQNIMTAAFNILQSHFELCLQNIESYSHVTADFKSCSPVIAYFKSCSEILNYNSNLLKVTVTWMQLLKSAVTWLQLSTFCSHNSKFYNCNF